MCKNGVARRHAPNAVETCDALRSTAFIMHHDAQLLDVSFLIKVSNVLRLYLAAGINYPVQIGIPLDGTDPTASCRTVPVMP